MLQPFLLFSILSKGWGGGGVNRDREGEGLLQNVIAKEGEGVGWGVGLVGGWGFIREGGLIARERLNGTFTVTLPRQDDRES